MCSRYVKDCTHELYKSALFGYTWVIIKHVKAGIVSFIRLYTACFPIFPAHYMSVFLSLDVINNTDKQLDTKITVY